ncbi:MAG: hypothetical protein BWY85_01651 [Firmicutes bacterium ADurb.Bin506]|nr:MAG: hypothetical protein BWY85_01651 [Firmicutes bacterium ADurb.Bin506]
MKAIDARIATGTGTARYRAIQYEKNAPRAIMAPCEKLAMPRMLYTSENPTASNAYMEPTEMPLTIC